MIAIMPFSTRFPTIRLPRAAAWMLLAFLSPSWSAAGAGPAAAALPGSFPDTAGAPLSSVTGGPGASAWTPGAESRLGNGGSRPSAGGTRGAAPNPPGPLRELFGAGDGEPEFLHPDAAFRVDASAPEPASVVVRWRIEPGHYLYRKRIEVTLAETSPEGMSVAGFDLPPGEVREDPYFGRVEVFRSETAAVVRLRHPDPLPPAVDLAVLYQGCADAGLCYPPIRKVLTVRLDGPGSGTAASVRHALASSGAGAGGGAAGAVFDASSSETDRIARFLAVDGLGASVAAFFGFGLLLSLTPCIFPMIPILSSILVADGRSGRFRGFSLALAYVSASALTWAAAGGAAGLLGANVQAALQNPWALGAVSAGFAALALSMFGLFRLGLPGAWATRAAHWTNRAAGGGGYAGAAAMGFVSALIVGPCAAAPMAGAVLYIGQAGDAVRGGIALFAMGFGMGAPLLVLGASSGRILPRAGPWMETMQRIAGVVLLGVAAWLLERIVPAWAVMAAWAAVAGAGAAVLARAARRQGPPPAEITPSPRFLRFAGGAGAAVAAVYAAVLLMGAATGARDPLDPFAGLRPSPADESRIEFIAVKGLDGPRGLDAALMRAAARGRFAMLDFYADWCVSCKEMEETTFRDPRVRGVLGGMLVLRTDVTANDEADRALMKRLEVLGPPSILFFGPDGMERRRYRTVGFRDAAEFAARAAGAANAA